MIGFGPVRRFNEMKANYKHENRSYETPEIINPIQIRSCSY